MAIAHQEASLVTQHDAAQGIHQATIHLGSILTELNGITNPEVAERNFCAFASLAAAVNSVKEKEIITADSTPSSISVGELVAIALRENNKQYPTNNGKTEEWWAVNSNGDTYHQAIVSIAKGLGVSAEAKEGFTGIEDFNTFLNEKNTERGALLLSVDNRFINEQTCIRLRRQPPELERGTHVISVLSYDCYTDTYTVFDPQGSNETFEVDANTINRYLTDIPRGIALSASEEGIKTIQTVPHTPNIRINVFVVEIIKNLLEMRHR